MFRTTSLIAVVSASLLCSPANADQQNTHWQDVSGTAIHYASTSWPHPDTYQATASGFTVVSTDFVEIFGDIEGRAVFQPFTTFDGVENTIVNTGHQVFSGTVLGSDPVMLYDDDFRFEIDLDTGDTTGEIYLIQQIAGPKARCIFSMQSTGQDADGNNLSEYFGQCRVW